MTSEERERMNSLCVGIREETDYNKFAALLHEMSELIARKEQRRFEHYSTRPGHSPESQAACPGNIADALGAHSVVVERPVCRSLDDQREIGNREH